MTIKNLKKNINTILIISQLSSLLLPFIYAISAINNTDTQIIRNIFAVFLLIITAFAFWYAIAVHDASRKEKLNNSYEDSVKILFENKFDKICEKFFINFVSFITIGLFWIPENIRTNNTKEIIIFLIITFLLGAPVYLAIDYYKEKGNSLLSYSLFSYSLVSSIIIPLFTLLFGASLLEQSSSGINFTFFVYPILLIAIIPLIYFYIYNKNKS